ncbi:MAG: hypothetical protein ACMUHX_01630 [bacterium]
MGLFTSLSAKHTKTMGKKNEGAEGKKGTFQNLGGTLRKNANCKMQILK